jgi:hypothetical protein
MKTVALMPLYATIGDHVESLEYLLGIEGKIRPILLEELLVAAVRANALGSYQFLSQFITLKTSTNDIHTAVRDARMDILKHMHKVGRFHAAKSPIQLLDMAYSSDSLECVTFIANIFEIERSSITDYNYRSMMSKIKLGKDKKDSLSLFKTIPSTYYGPTMIMTGEIIKAGDLKILRYLHEEHNRVVYHDEYLYETIERGYDDVFDYIVKVQWPDNDVPNDLLNDVLDKCFKVDNLHVFEWCLAIMKKSGNSWNAVYMFSKGDIKPKIYRYLLDNPDILGYPDYYRLFNQLSYQLTSDK